MRKIGFPKNQIIFIYTQRKNLQFASNDISIALDIDSNNVIF